jgi:hypothetical protein
MTPNKNYQQQQQQNPSKNQMGNCKMKQKFLSNIKKEKKILNSLHARVICYY